MAAAMQLASSRQRWLWMTMLAKTEVVGAIGHAVQVGLTGHHAEGVHVRGAAAQRRRGAVPTAGARVVHEPERRVLAHALHARTCAVMD